MAGLPANFHASTKPRGHEMRKLSVLLALFACLGIACKGGNTSSITGIGDPGKVIATVNDVKITAGELNEAAKNRLQKVEQEVYGIKKDVLDSIIEKKLIEQAAAKQGKTAENYIKENVDDKAMPPADDEIKNFYEARKDQMGGKPLKDVQDSIKTFLMQGRKQGLQQQLMGGLRAAANLKIDLEVPRVDVEAGDNPSLGSKGATVTLIEFTDYQCPFCGRVRATVNQLLDDYKGKIKYVLRDYPLPFHQFAKKAHEAAHCAGDQDKYWEYNKTLWAHQQELQIDKLKEYAKGLKLDAKDFDKCLDGGKYTKKVEENAEAGGGYGVQGTPSFFINGIFLSGARPVTDFKNIIDQELKK